MSLHFATVGAGGPVDVCWHNSRLLVAYQRGAGTNVSVVVDTFSAALERIETATYAIGNDAGAFPRLLSAAGSWWLVYREGASLGGSAILKRDGLTVWRSTASCGGNDPVCLGFDTTGHPAFAWQRSGTNEILSALCEWPHAQLHEGNGRPTGLSHFDANARVVLVDDARGAVAGMTRPSWAGLLVAGEHPDAGVLVTYYDRQLRLWPSQPTYTPRLSHDRGLYAVATWNASGIVLATFTIDDLVVPVPPPQAAPWPPGVGWTKREDIADIDVADYLLGANWSRNGMHVAADGVTYTHPFQARSGAGWVQHTKFAPPDTRAATWTLTQRWIGLAYDGTNELAKGYRFVVPGTTQTAAIYPRRMKVGKAHAHTTRVGVLDLSKNTERVVTFTGYVEAVYDGPQVGDLPPTQHAVIVFDPASDDPRGWRETNIGAKGLGCWYWHQARKEDGAQPDMRWVGTVNASRVPDIPVPYADAAPFVPVIEDTDTVRIWNYNDADATKVIDFLALKYTTPTESGGLGRAEVDHLGYARWLHDAVRLLDGGKTVDQTLREINRRINVIVGLPTEAWPGGDGPGDGDITDPFS